MGEMSYLQSTLGLRWQFVLELLVSELMFILPAKPRIKIYFIPLIYAAFLAYAFFVPFIPIPIGYIKVAFNCALIFFVSVGVQIACYKTAIRRTVFDCSAGYIVQNLTLNVREFFSIALSLTGGAKIAVETVIRIVVYATCFFGLAYRNRKRTADLHGVWIVVICIASVTVSNILFSMININIEGSSVYLKLVFIVLCIIALLFQFSIYRNEELVGKNQVIEQLLATEQKQHTLSQKNIDFINMKCHDIKKQIGLLKKSVSDEEFDNMIKEVEEAVTIYGDTFKTGNPNLDLVLSEKQLYCQKHGIKIEVIADGAALSFIDAPDMFSLFANALDNAIESLLKTDRENRSIGLYIKRRDDIVCIKMQNYCKDPVAFDKDVPLTTKQDKTHHGFGTLSMKYIVEKYNGNIVFEKKDDMFVVDIILPVPDVNLSRTHF